MTKKEQNAKIAQQMRQHVASWQASKMTSREYCASNGLPQHKIYYWLNKIKKEQAGIDVSATGFSQVRPGEVSSTAQSHSGSTLPTPTMEVNLSNGTRIVFYHAICKDLLNTFL